MSWDIHRQRLAGGRPRVLAVDDDNAILRLITRILENHGYAVTGFGDPESAAFGFREGEWDAVVTDVNMPGMGGLGLLHALLAVQPNLPVVVVTGEGTVETAIRALREGATGMLLKPFCQDDLLAEITRSLEAARMRREALQYRVLSPILDSIALTLSSAIEARNLETAAHCRHLGLLSERMASALGLPGHDQMTIRIAGYLHDVGKIGIRDAVLLKPGRLDDEEMAEMRRHSEIGAEILEVHEAMAGIARIVRHHHERWDGRGYPGGLSGNDIPLGGRIIAVADSFHAMTHDRVYRPALPVEVAWQQIRAGAGSQFDPAIVEVFALVVDEAGRVRPRPEDRLDADLGPACPPSDPSLPLRERLASLPSFGRAWTQVQPDPGSSADHGVAPADLDAGDRAGEVA